MKLIKVLNEQFNPEEVSADNYILYEVSGFQDKIKDEQDFKD